MRQLLLVAPLLLAACAITDNQKTVTGQTTSDFVQGYSPRLTLRQMTGNAPTMDEVRFIATNFIYDGKSQCFENVRTAGYRPSLTNGTDVKGNATMTMTTNTGSVLFTFDKRGKLRDAVALSNSGSYFRR